VSGAPAAGACLAWLVTYGVHGAIATVVAEVLVRLAHPSPADEHRLWRIALVLPLATAWLFVPFGSRPLAARLAPTLPVILRLPSTSMVTSSFAPSDSGQAVLAGAFIAALGALAGMACFAYRVVRLRRQLADRRTPTDPRLRSSLARLCPRFRLAGDVQLTESAQLTSPTAVGTRAICFPSVSIASLGDDELDAVLAHELAHLERRDPSWFFLAGFVQAALWMQPFNHLVAARFRRSAEIACDDRAVIVTDHPLCLARALGRLAHAAWAGHTSMPAQASLAGSARTSNALVDRVRRLATGRRGAPSVGGCVSRFGTAGALLVLAVIASSNLGVTFAGWSGSPAAASGGEASPAATRQVAAASARAAHLDAQASRLQREISAANDLASGVSTIDADAHLQQLEQDLRHTREERAWLERSVSHPIAPGGI
jgi:beta-lactamase regulating signal transducer with metallopeptidase domain